jgi:hypothetical protein
VDETAAARQALEEMDASLAKWLRSARTVLQHGNYGQLASLVEKVEDAESRVLAIDGRVERKHLRMWAAADVE